MIFSLDVLRARKGDCLLLHFGAEDEPGLVMIDGGPRNVYQPQLKPRIMEIRRARSLADEEPLMVDLLMVSHLDDDHIQGILDLAREEIEAADAQRPRLLNVQSFWHNSFDEIIDGKPDELTASLTEQFGAASVSGAAELPDEAKLEVEEKYEKDHPDEDNLETVTSSLKVLASIEQGFRLRGAAEKLDYPRNPEFGGKLIVARADGDPVSITQDLKLTVIGPMQPEMKALHKKHEEWLRNLAKEGKRPPEALAAYVDKSVPNLSSIVVLAECNGKSILLTGDARGDKILDGLQLVGLLDPGEDSTIAVDILKVPHHGSANNINPDFFERIIAKHYVFSGDGEHGNPEREAIKMLLAAQPDEAFTIHLTYPVDEIDAGRKADWEKEQAKEVKKRDRKKTQEEKAKVKVRPDWSPEKQSLYTLLDEKLWPRQKVRIVEAGKPHVIDLLDTLGF